MRRIYQKSLARIHHGPALRVVALRVVALRVVALGVLALGLSAAGCGKATNGATRSTRNVGVVGAQRDAGADVGSDSDRDSTGVGGGKQSSSQQDSTDGAGGSGAERDPITFPASEARPELPVFSCGEVRSQQFDEAHMAPYSLSLESSLAVEATLAAMSSEAKYTQMMGVDGTVKNYRDIMRGPDVDVPGIGVLRGFRFRDSGRGVVLDAGQDNRVDHGRNYSTGFPAPSLRAASWDLDLEMRVGAAIADETAASHNNVVLAPVVNIVRHPFWGRVQETYGEDGYHLGRMATAFTVGVQRYMTACAKFFAGNTVEELRSQQDAVMDEQTLREVYGRHFEMVVQDGGVGCVMATYNLVNGVKATQNAHLLRDVLKGPASQGGMGFKGFVTTELWAMPGDQEWPDQTTAQAVASGAVNAGTDVERPWTLHYNPSTLQNTDQHLVDEAARRVVTQKYRFGSALDTDPWSLRPPVSKLAEDSIAPNEAHEALAEEAALKSMVLLANGLGDDAVLPLRGVERIAVVGPDEFFRQISSSVPNSCPDRSEFLGSGQQSPARECYFRFAVDAALGDRGSSRINTDLDRTFGPYDGIASEAGQGVTVTSGNAVTEAADAQAVVVVVGYTPEDEGEEYYIADGGDRSRLDLPLGQNEFVHSVLDLGLPTVIVVESGSIVNVPWLQHENRNQATIWAGYPGQRGGLALGKLIFGRANFSGKMPLAWPAEAELLPFKSAELLTNMGYYFGYREFDRRTYVEGQAVDLVFSFGHGLSYSSFEYGNLSSPCTEVGKEAVVEVSVEVTNTSSVDGEEVVQLFVKPPPKPAGMRGARPWKELASFSRVAVPAGQTVTAQLPLRVRDLRRWEGDTDGRWRVDSGDYTILVGKDAEDAERGGLQATLTVAGD